MDAQTCFYSDFTVPQTGAPAEQSCGSLAAGACAINCPCDPVRHPYIEDLQVINRCRYVSEENPVGICTSPDSCYDGSMCHIPGSVCMKVKVPEWVEEYASTQTGWSFPSPNSEKGYCVMRDACEAWAAKNPGVVTSGCSDVALEPPTVGEP